MSDVLQKRFDPAGWQWESDGRVYQLEDLSRNDLLQVACAAIEVLERMDLIQQQMAKMTSDWRRGCVAPGDGAVYCVPTEQESGGMETYTHHREPVPMADNIVLYTSSAQADAAPVATKTPLSSDVSWDGNGLPPVGCDIWFECGASGTTEGTVTGYRALTALSGSRYEHRVFVDLVYKDSEVANSRMLAEVRPIGMSLSDREKQAGNDDAPAAHVVGPNEYGSFEVVPRDGYTPKNGDLLYFASQEPSPSKTVQREAAFYRRLRILGCAPGGSRNLGCGTVLCFQSLDDYVHKDILNNPGRGEAKAEVVA